MDYIVNAASYQRFNIIIIVVVVVIIILLLLLLLLLLLKSLFNVGQDIA